MAQRVLVQHVSGHGEEVRLGVTDGLLVIDPQQPQEHLLGEVGHVVNIVQAHGQESPQPPPVLGRERGDEASVFGTAQDRAPAVAEVLERWREESGYGRMPETGLRPPQAIHSIGTLSDHEWKMTAD